MVQLQVSEKDLANLLNQLNKGVENAIYKSCESAMENGYRAAFLEAGLKAPPELAGADPTKLKELAKALAEPIQDYNKALGEHVADYMSGAIDQGGSMDTAARGLQSSIVDMLKNEPITIQREGKNPVSFTADHYANIVSSTVPYAIRNDAYAQKCEDLGISDGWNSITSGMENVCEICKAKMEFGLHTWEEEERPPYHPFCNCRMKQHISKEAREGKIEDKNKEIEEAVEIAKEEPQTTPEPFAFLPATTPKEAKNRLLDLFQGGSDSWKEARGDMPKINRFRHSKITELAGTPKVPKMSLDLSNMVLEKVEVVNRRCEALGIPSLQGMETAGKYAGTMGDGVLGLNVKSMEAYAAQTIEKQISSAAGYVTHYDEQIARYTQKLEQARSYLQQGKTANEVMLKNDIKTYEEYLTRFGESKAYYQRFIENVKGKGDLRDYDWFAENPGKMPYVSSELFKDPKLHIQSVIEHEFWHHIHQQLDVIPNDRASFINPPLEQKIARAAGKKAITKYSASNSKEWLAENGVFYTMGYKDKCDPVAIPIIEEVLTRMGAL